MFASRLFPPRLFPPRLFPERGGSSVALSVSRDWLILEAIAAQLEATEAFDGVYLTGLPEDVGESSGECRVAALEILSWEEVDEWDNETMPGYQRSVTFRLTILARDCDPLVRDRMCDQLGNIASNALNMAGHLGVCDRGRSLLSRGSYAKPRHPERRLTMTGEFTYLVEGPTPETLGGGPSHNVEV